MADGRACVLETSGHPGARAPGDGHDGSLHTVTTGAGSSTATEPGALVTGTLAGARSQVCES